jgi:glycosyltransferase involved in cell wall biosynthesis
MAYTVTKRDNQIYSNVDKDSGYVPLSSYAFNIPVKPGKIDSIGLFFNTSGEVTGKITAEVYLDKAHRRYTIKSEQIIQDSPIVLDMNYHPKSDCIISILLEVEKGKGTGHFGIKMCSGGPCLYLEGENSTLYEFEDPPLISIIMPVYKTNLGYLKKTVESVLNQSYGIWELCIVDDGSNDPELKNYLESILYNQIKVRINTANKGIVEATNEALAMATGKYVGFLDHDDLLDKDALLYVALEYRADSGVDLIYTDEDKVLDDGSFVGPFYKPDFNYSLLLSSMYMCHFSVYRKSLVNEVGDIRKGFDGSQDYDLALRIVEHTKNIRHIPRILYHWRITPTSTSSSIVNKPDARFNGARALEGHLKRLGRKAIVTAGYFPGHYDVRYIPLNYPRVSIIIPFKDQIHVLNNLLKTFEMTSYPNYELLLVNNKSEEKGTFEYLSKLSFNRGIKIIEYNKKFNFSAINNYAVNNYTSESEFVLFLNNDIEIMHPEWLHNMIQHFIRPEVAAVGAKLLYMDHKIQHAGIFIGVNGVAGHSHKYIYDWVPGYFSRPHLTQDITAVTGACMLVRRSDFQAVKGFDIKLPKAFNDIDLCLKLRQKEKSIVYTPFARLYHRESYTRGLDSAADEQFLKAISYINDKWELNKFRDPFYNTNLPDNCEGKSWI